MTTYRAPKGTFDLYSPRVELYQRVEAAARRVFARHGFSEIRTPIFEETGLFARGVGEGSDLVNKEMYTFTDRGDRSMTLRPEGTAAVVRALIENRLADQPLHQRVFYIGPMFRYERPQKGRYRQFHQIGVEAIGEVPPALEAEILAMVAAFLKELGLGAIRLQVNSIGDGECRPGYLVALTEFVRAHLPEVCAECHVRFERNVLRCLDCKNDSCRAVYANAPRITDALCEPCRAHHDAFKAALAAEGIPFTENPFLVRGLDYYRRTAFEAGAEGLGAQDALLGGGRYDDLIKELGGPALPGFGFGIGLDRLALALEHAGLGRPAPAPACALLPEDSPAAAAAARELARALREADLPVWTSPKPGPFGAQFKWAGKLFHDAELLAAAGRVPYALVIGSNELAAGTVQVKRFDTGAQTAVPRADLAAWLVENART